MNLLPADKNKRDKLLLVLIGVVGVVVALYVIVIGPQYESLSKMTKERKVQEAKLQEIMASIKNAAVLGKNLQTASAHLKEMETDIATGDLYVWVFDTLRQFKSSYRNVNIPTVGQPVTSDVDLVVPFPYKQAKVAVVGTGYYHDIGKFISDVENGFPHVRVLNVAMEPVDLSGENQKLSFRMDLVFLTKSNP